MEIKFGLISLLKTIKLVLLVKLVYNIFMKKIRLNGKYKDHICLIDDLDFDKVKNRVWHGQCRKKGETVYALDGHRNLMHQVLLGKKDGLTIDHINGNGLDNRRKNLRFCTQKQNSRNNKRRKNLFSSKYKGVYKKTYKSGKMSWVASITVDNKHIYLGTFENEEHAGYAYNLGAKKYFKEYASLNKLPKEKYSLPDKNERIKIRKNNLLLKPTQKLITFNNETHNIAEWAKIKQIKPATLQRRLALGWKIKDALNKPVQQH